MNIYDEIDVILNQIKVSRPNITNGEIVKLLPKHLRQPFWERVVDKYIKDSLAKISGA